jgi:hypothetical protein
MKACEQNSPVVHYFDLFPPTLFLRPIYTAATCGEQHWHCALCFVKVWFTGHTMCGITSPFVNEDNGYAVTNYPLNTKIN